MRGRLAVAALITLTGLLTVPAEGQSALPCATPEKVVGVTPQGTAVMPGGSACTVPTGYLTGETHLRVAPDGTVVQQPAQTVPGVAGSGFVPGAPGPKPQTQITPAGFVVSRDGGRSFGLVYPSGAQWVASDGAIHIDRATGRLYYYALAPVVVPASGSVPLTDQVPAGYAHLLTSDDDGRTWFHTTAPGYVESENPRFTSGPAPRGGDRAVPGESVAYWCGNTILFAYGQRDCWRTLDGGHTWAFRSTLLRSVKAVHPECGTAAEDFNAGDGYYPQVGPDGVLWSVVSCGGRSYLARSSDEGLTFPISRAVPPIDELRVDSRGTLYGVTQSGAALMLRTSKDAGRNWSRPVDLVSKTRHGAALGQWALALRGPGQLAVAYLTDHPGAGKDGSVTLLRGGLLLSSTVHDGRLPLVTSPTSAKDDYIDLDVAPDGSAWAAFYADCGNDAACSTSSTNPLAKIGLLLHVS